MPTGQPSATTVAEAYLAHLAERGIRRLFVNAGTDFAPIVEAYSRVPDSRLRFPDVVVCGHENLPVSMAHGAYLGSGRPQAVMLHTSVGTANAVCAILNAARDRISILLTAGRTPLFEDSVLGARNGAIHRGQEMFDQAGMVREMVKWDYELRDGWHVGQVVDRALDVATTHPRGPAYLTLPREVLAAPARQPARRLPVAAASAPHPAPDAVARLADLIAGARLPVIATSASGADERTVGLLEKLATEFAVGVVDIRPRYHDISGHHPLHLGYAIEPMFADTDLLCFLDVDVPWTPSISEPGPGTTVVQCGPDPHFSCYPMRGHGSDLSITATTHALLEALFTELDRRRADVDDGRRERLEAFAVIGRAKRADALAAEAAATGPITKQFMNWALAQLLDPDVTIVNEYWARADLLPLTEPGSYFGPSPAGGLGWGLPAAIGLKLARPDRTVVATVGDGAYLFANPAACHHAMAMHDLPVLTIVCNNAEWNAVESSALSVYPSGHTAAAGELTPFARLAPAPAFAAYAEASGGRGELVTEREELVPALRRALHTVRTERRAALVDVACE